MQSRNWVPLASLFVLQATASYGQEAIGKATSVRPQESTTISQNMEGLASDQLSETSDHRSEKSKGHGRGKNGGLGLCRIRRRKAGRKQNRPIVGDHLWPCQRQKEFG